MVCSPVYFVLFPSYSPSTLPVWLSILFTFVLSIYNRKILIFGLPFISLLSPIAGPNNFLPFLPSEIYILTIFIVGFFYKVFTRDTKLILFKGDVYLLIIFSLVLLSSFHPWKHFFFVIDELDHDCNNFFAF